MIAQTVSALALALSLLPAPGVDVGRPAAWDEQDVFRTEWLLPQESQAGRALRERWARWIAWRAEPAPDDARLRSIGDLARALRSIDSRAERDRLRSAFARIAGPELGQAALEAVREVTEDRLLAGGDWDPEDDVLGDGLWMAGSWSLKNEPKPWSRVRGNRDVLQCAALVFADLEVIKAVENDYPRYPDRVGAEYRYIHAVDGSYVRGGEGPVGPFTAHRIEFKCPLPFPFGGYTCDLRILNRLDGEGNLLTDIHSASKGFHWMAGRDVFLPLRDADGEWVAMVMVRQFGFDLKGVPDGESHRWTALRSGVGNLKRLAEPRFAGSQEPPLVTGEIPGFVVRGAK